MDKKKIIKISISSIAVLLFMLLGGSIYMYSHGLSGKYVNPEVKDGQIKVACVGDSITYGHGVENWKQNNYPAQLQQILGDKYNVANFGSSTFHVDLFKSEWGSALCASRSISS